MTTTHAAATAYQDKCKAEHNAKVGFKEYRMSWEIEAEIAASAIAQAEMVQRYKDTHDFSPLE